MKKNLYLIGMLFVALFLGVSNVKAYYINPNNDCYTTGSVKICNLKVRDVSSGAFNTMTLDVYYQNNSPLSSVSIASGWTTISTSNLSAKTIQGASYSGGKRYVLSYSKNAISAGTYDIGTFSFSLTGDTNCSIVFSPSTSNEKRECSVSNGIYYNIDGDEVSYSEYKTSCGCRTTNGKYYDTNGNETTELNYIKTCLKPTCVQLSDGTYMGSNGLEVTKDEYASQCGYKCGYLDGTYYDKDGNVVLDEKAMILSCNPGICKPATLSDGTVIYFGSGGTIVEKATYEDQCFEKPKCKVDNGKYYDKDGNETDEETYAKQCTTITCRILSDGTIYGNNGEVVDKLTYEKQCSVHTCEVLSDKTHYDKDGNEVNEDEYLKSCYNCRNEDNKYYDENGKETTEENWNAMCKPHKCEIVADKYFNDKGKLVTKDEYEKACTNPKTGDRETTIMYIYIFGGLALTGTLLFVSRKYSKIRRV